MSRVFSYMCRGRDNWLDEKTSDRNLLILSLQPFIYVSRLIIFYVLAMYCTLLYGSSLKSLKFSSYAKYDLISLLDDLLRLNFHLLFSLAQKGSFSEFSLLSCIFLVFFLISSHITLY
jgi:hypothetical protein